MIRVVIGSNYGDEGKGLLTDYHVSQMKSPLVIRFNGGAQAGHTVVTPDGIRHVFKHFSSGSFLGAPTFLSSHYVVNPILMVKELESLKRAPLLFVSPRCLITTPYDMILNQLVEDHRGVERHGSCGVGFNETIVRNETFPFTVQSLMNHKHSQILDVIRKEYFPKRCQELGIPSIPDMYLHLLKDDGIFKGFLSDLSEFLRISTFCELDRIWKNYKDVVFEGAQGLLLDQNKMEYFPHLTRSNTGLQNVVEILKEIDCKETIYPTYVTRCYLTRHGSGPLNWELKEKPYPGIEDLTNIHNQYQGSLRFALLDVDLLSETIKKDLCLASDFDIQHSLAITCLDQVGDYIRFVKNNKIYELPVAYFEINMRWISESQDVLVSYGPTRETIHNIYY